MGCNIGTIAGGNNTFQQFTTAGAKTDLKEAAEPKDCQEIPDEPDEMHQVPDAPDFTEIQKNVMAEYTLGEFKAPAVSETDLVETFNREIKSQMFRYEFSEEVMKAGIRQSQAMKRDRN